VPAARRALRPPRLHGELALEPLERAVGANAAQACFACHTSQRARDYVFSNPRK
jgi:hypothetical protein